MFRGARKSKMKKGAKGEKKEEKKKKNRKVKRKRRENRARSYEEGIKTARVKMEERNGGVYGDKIIWIRR